jgi:hypothetical protein
MDKIQKDFRNPACLFTLSKQDTIKLNKNMEKIGEKKILLPLKIF